NQPAGAFAQVDEQIHDARFDLDPCFALLQQVPRRRHDPRSQDERFVTHYSVLPFGKSMRTISELSRKRSKTIRLPSAVTSKVRIASRCCSRVSCCVFID